MSRLFFTLTQIGIHGDAKDGACGVCILQEEAWEDRVINEAVVYNSKFKTDFGRYISPVFHQTNREEGNNVEKYLKPIKEKRNTCNGAES